MTKHNYTPENLEKAIIDCEKMVELNKKVTKNYYELLFSFKRIKRAINPIFWLPEALKEEKKLAEIELIKERGQDPLHARGNALIRAKARLMRKEGQFFKEMGRDHVPWDYGHIANMFADFEFYLKRQWEGDRKRLIDEGEIEGEIIDMESKN